VGGGLSFHILTDSHYPFGIFKHFNLLIDLLSAMFQCSGDHPYEEFEDTKVAIRINKSKNRQHNGQREKDKRIHNDKQSMHIKLNID
jgi:hypothetical protein